MADADLPRPDEFNPPYRLGIRIGSVKDGKVVAFILESVEVDGLEAVAVGDDRADALDSSSSSPYKVSIRYESDRGASPIPM